MNDEKLKLIGSITSPYTRFVKVLCEELCLVYELETTAPFGKLNYEQEKLIKSKNPLNRVPILVVGKDSLIESRIICSYLIKLHSEKAPLDFNLNTSFNIKEENFLSMVYGALDYGILNFMITNSDPELDITKGFFPKMIEKIKQSLECMNEQIELDDEFLMEKFGMPQIALCCTLEWFKKRNIYDWSNYKGLNTLYTKWKDRDSLLKTRIPESI